MTAIFLSIPAFIVLIAVEIWVSRRREGAGYEAKDTAASLSMGVGNVVISTAIKGLWVVWLALFWELRLFEWDPASPWTWVAAFVFFDLVYYWWHRAGHEIRWLWAAHENHHSSQHFNLSTALRQSWTTPFTGLPFYWILPVMGFDPFVTATILSINTVGQFWFHTELIGRMGPLEWVLNTPSHHRVHHGANPQYLDRNYAGIFIVWDRLFGTFEAEHEPVRYGLSHNIDTFNPLRIATIEWVAMFRDAARCRTFSGALRTFWGRPGWREDGTGITAPMARAAWEAQRQAPEAQVASASTS